MDEKTNDVDTVEEIEDVPQVEDGAEDSTDYKAKYLEAQGIAKRLKSKLEKQKLDSKVEKKVEQKLEEKGLDRLDKAILRVEKITAPAEVELVEAMMKESGKDVEGVLASKYFQSELAALREAQATKDATPEGTKRSGQSPRDDVDYWIAKGELPPADQPELRMKVVARKREVLASKSQFSENAVIS